MSGPELVDRANDIVAKHASQALPDDRKAA